MPVPAPAGIWGPRKNPAKRFLWGEEPQGSARSFHQQVETEQSGLCGDEFAGSRPGRRGTFSYTRIVTLRLFATPGFPPSRTGLRAAMRPCARPRCGPSGLLTTAPRFSESTQRACPGGEPPGYPPTQLKCRHSFPASWTGRCGNSFGGLWPCADLLSVVSSIQLGAWRGCEKRLGGSIGRARAEGQRSVSCFRSTHHPQGCAPFRGSLFGAVPSQAAHGGAEDGQVWRHKGIARRGNCPAVEVARRKAVGAPRLTPPRTSTGVLRGQIIRARPSPADLRP